MILGNQLEQKAITRPADVAYTFTDSERNRATVTYGELWSTVRALAGILQARASAGDRVVVLCNPSLSYISCFFATVVAGLVAVPAYPVAASRHADRVKRIVRDCQPRIILADSDQPANPHELGLTADVSWINISGLEDGALLSNAPLWERPDMLGDSLAFLQYTSGSTGTPKGVMVSHGNLLNNAEAARLTFDFSPESIMVSWLPPFHDMGLIGCIITPLVVGFPSHLMAPATFLRRPLRWLELISEFRATDSTAPNFAYRLCAERANEADIESLDLSSWTRAMNGAEPVSADALESFARAYAGAGFDPTSYRPCYGMAEATLLISGRHTGQSTPRMAVPEARRPTPGPTTFVTCGAPEPAATIRIVNPDTGERVPEGHEGEIWVSSPSVTQGYWQNPKATAETFEATTADGEGPFLRTGDLGFMDGDELFVTGRIKDILIINGRNIYPQDLEDAVRNAHKAFAGRTAAAFESNGRTVVAVEAVVGPKVSVDEIGRSARRAAADLSSEFETSLPLVVVLRRGTLTTTSSGKIQRSAAREAWNNGTLENREIARSDTWAGDSQSADAPSQSAGTGGTQPRLEAADRAASDDRSSSELRTRLLRELSRVAGRQGGVSPRAFLSDLHLDSIKVAALATAIEDATGIRVPLSLAWEVDTVESFVTAVSQLARDSSEQELTQASSRLMDGTPEILLTGAACRLPGGVTHPQQYWNMIRAGGARTAVTSEGAARTGFHAAGLVPELAEFNPAVFGLRQDEAELMDPRQRLALTLAWEALEDAGHDPRLLRGMRIGVYVGGSDSEYVRASARNGRGAGPAGYQTTGSAGSLLANRISYVLGLRGPSITVDSACSSSLVSTHLALQALRSGEIDVAVVGGVNALLDGEVSNLLAEAGMLSPKGSVSAFDQSADGYVRGEGGVVLVLERRKSSIGRRPEPYCRVLGSAVNQDGRSNGLTAPNGLAQQDVVRRALESAGRTPEDVGYIEAHGTGTPLGDPVEVHALSQVFGTEPNDTPLWLGAAKAQIGHLEAAAGIAGLLRAALIVRGGLVPPQAEYAHPSDRIDWAHSRLQVPKQPIAWSDPRRTAGVSSFGFGGTNAHVVLESIDDRPEVPLQHDQKDHEPTAPVLLRFSADSEATLRTQCAQIANSPVAAGTVAALAAATERSRVSGPYRRWTVADRTEDVRTALTRLREGASDASEAAVTENPTVTFLAPGHGAPIAGCLAQIYPHDPVIEHVLDGFGDTSEFPLRALLVDDGESREALTHTAIAQPALYALAVAVGERLRAWGVTPTSVLGHSVGAFAAASLSGSLDRLRGFELISERGRLMEGTTEGGMLSCQADLSVAEEIAARTGLDVAVANGPGNTVLSGTPENLREAEAVLKQMGIRATRLPVSRAFHSRLMASIAAELAAAVKAAHPSAAREATFISDIDGSTDAHVDVADYWVNHALYMIDFRPAARLAAQSDIVVELGPSYLSPIIVTNAEGRPPILTAAIPRGAKPESLLELAGRLWAAGVRLDTLKGYKGTFPRLPTTIPATHVYSLESTPVAGRVAERVPAVARRAGDRGDRPAPAGIPGSAEQWTRYLRSELGTRLGAAPDQLDDQAGLFDLGLTSVVANDLRGIIDRQFGVQLRSTVVFEYPTISLLAGHLETLVPRAHDDDAGSPHHTERALDNGGRRTRAATGAPGAARTEQGHDRDEQIVVVGMACRFPGGAESVEEFWSLIRNGDHVMVPPPPERWSDLDPASAEHDSGWSTHGGFLSSDPAVFAADHFGISPREARSMDPQHRLLLETTHYAVVDAGLSRESLRGQSAGVWIGLSTSDYATLRPQSPAPDPYAVTGNSPSLASGRIAHYLGINGPAVTVDTACSSSLVACHQAVEALRSREVDIAIVGGVNLMLAAETTRRLGDMGALSPSGRCSTFSAQADGYARGEGCGVVVLRRQRVNEDADTHIWASLLGTAVNHDGVSAGLTVPNGKAQRRVIEAAIRDSGVGPDDLDYIEAHGTGTPLGDPIELEALSTVFDNKRQRPLFLGSVKAQIGHLEAAAGIAGLIKSILIAHNRHIPAHPLGTAPTPEFDWSGSRVQLSQEDHGPSDVPITCGVSAFGFSGTNAHVVVSSPLTAETASRSSNPAAGMDWEPKLLMVAGNSEQDIRDQLAVITGELERPGNSFEDLLERSARGGVAGAYRFACVAQDAEEAIRAAQLQINTAPGQGNTDDSYFEHATQTHSSVWLFSGVGSQWKGMYRHLSTDSTIRKRLASADAIVQDMGYPSIRDDLWYRSGRQEHLHPSLTAVQVALAGAARDLLGAPDHVIGYSAGTIAALADTGWLDLPDALELAAWRGKLVDAAAGTGGTAACGLSADQALSHFERMGLDDLVIASITGPENCTVSGPVPQLSQLEDFCRTTGTWWLSISDSIPYHHPILQRFVDQVDGAPRLTWRTGSCTPLLFASGSTFEEIRSRPETLVTELWRPADLSAVADELGATGAEWTLLEISPQPTLGPAMCSWRPNGEATYAPASVPGRNPSRQIRRAVARLWTRGHDSPTNPRKQGSGQRLPGKRFWWEADSPEPGKSETTGTSDDTYRLRWRTDQSQPRRHAPLPRHWTLIADQGTAMSEGLSKAFASLGHSLDVQTWDFELVSEGASTPRHGIVIDATNAPAPHADLEWHRRLIALLRTWSSRDGEVWAVTRGATTAGGAVELGGAAVWGVARAISTELPQSWGGVIDLSPGGIWSDLDADRVAQEVINGGTEDQVAFRGGLRRVPRLHRLPAVAHRQVQLDEEASYLVTGGSGTLGRRMVRWLATRGARHIVLAARSDVEVQRSRLGTLPSEIEAIGAHLYFVQADATDRDRMEGLFSGVPHEWPAIRGVLHLAGHMTSQPFVDTTVRDFQDSWDSKARGAAVLEDIAREHPLDFVVLFSSASSVWGSAMAAPYVCANYGLDVIAHRAAMNGLPFVSVNWSWWPDTAMADGVQEYFTRMGLGAVDDAVGWAAMDRAVMENEVGLVVAPIEWTSFRTVMSARRPRPVFDEVSTAENATHDGRSVTSASAGGLRQWTRAEIGQQLEASLQKVMRTNERIDPARGFFDMGIDSIMILELKRDIESWSGQDLDHAFLFEHPRLSDLAEALSRILRADDSEGRQPASPSIADSPDEAPGAGGFDDLDTKELLTMLEQELGSTKGPGRDEDG